MRNRRSAFVVEWREPGNPRPKTRAFASAEARETFARDLAAKRAEHGQQVLSFDPREWALWLRFREIVGPGVDPVVVAHEWRAMQQGTAGGGNAMTVATAVETYLKRRFAGKLSGDTKRHLKKHLQERFAARFGTLELREVTPELIQEQWLDTLIHPRTGEPMDNLTKRHHRKDLNTFLDHAVSSGWIQRNPCQLVAVPPSEDEEVFVLPLADAQRFFQVNRHEPGIGRVALEAFAGLRYSTAARIQREDINFAQRGIAMPGAAHKSGKRKYRQGHPDNLWAWLEHAPAACWEMTPLQYREAKRMMLIRAGIRPATITADNREDVDRLHNVWRHSFASYHLALYKTPPTTAYLMQHKHTSTTEIYEGRADEGDARAYFGIVPGRRKRS